MTAHHRLSPLCLIVFLAGACGGSPLGEVELGHEDIAAKAEFRGLFLHGKITWQQNGSPARCVVHLKKNGDSTPPAETTTNDSGNFAFFDVAGEPADYRVVVLINGVVDQELSLEDVRAGEKMPEIQITGVRDVLFLRGQTTFEAGLPYPISIELVRLADEEVVDITTSNYDGNFAFFKVEGYPFEYELRLTDGVNAFMTVPVGDLLIGADLGAIVPVRLSEI